MLRTVKSPKALPVIIVALLVAFTSAKLLPQGGALDSLLWGVFAFLSAFIATNKKEALGLGGVFGLVVSYSYLWFDNTSHNTAAEIAFLIFLILLPASFGLVCGMLTSWLGWIVRKRVLKQ